MVGFVGILLALIRFSTFIFFLPLFNMRNIPAQVKVGFAGLLALLVSPTYSGSVDINNPLAWGILITQEVGVGLTLAFVTILVFGIIYFAGQLIDVPMGFGMVSIFDPATSMQLPVFSQFYHLLGSLVFLAVDGHLWLFRALSMSYQMVPAGEFFGLNPTFNAFLSLSGQLFSLGLQIAIPVMGTILLTDLALGIVTKTVPQINVFVIGFPIKIMVGLIILLFVLPFYINFAATLFGYDGLLLRNIQVLLGG